MTTGNTRLRRPSPVGRKSRPGAGRTGDGVEVFIVFGIVPVGHLKGHGNVLVYWLPYSPGVPLAVWMARTPAWSREIYPRPGPPSRTRTFLRLSFPGLRPWWHYKAHRRFSRQSRERGQTSSAVNGPGHRSKNGVRCSDFRKGVKSGAPKGLGFGALKFKRMASRRPGYSLCLLS